jgi:hypothetical protein
MLPTESIFILTLLLVVSSQLFLCISDYRLRYTDLTIVFSSPPMESGKLIVDAGT